jgi:putative nucleotidyltransferase with HDIG domain
MIIADMIYEHGAAVCGEFRIRQPRVKTAANGNDYLSMIIEDRSGELRACLFTGEVPPPPFQDLDRIKLCGHLRRLNDAWLVNVTRIGLLRGETENPVRLIPRSLTPLPTLLEKLDILVSSFIIGPLRQFVTDVLKDDAIAFPFVSLPASSRHHHCTGSGLLEHSLECVAMVARFIEFSQADLEVAMIGALFHDIGKIRTIRCPGKHTLSGAVLDHDALTLEVLAGHLQKLDCVNPDAALALRYLWTWRQGKNARGIPLLTIAEAIAAADRISSGINIAEETFSNLPDWQRFTKANSQALIWRPRLATN